MKSLIFSLCALIALVGVITWNSMYIGRITDTLESTVSELTPNDAEKLSSAQSYWEKNEHIICIFVSHKDIDNVNLAFSVLKEKIENNDGGGFYEYRALLERYIKEIGNKERFHIDNII